MKRLFGFFMGLVLLLTSVIGAGAAPAEERPAKVDAHLWAQAQKKADKKIPVIIQMANQHELPDHVVAKHGGRALERFGFVGAVRAEVPAGRLAQLSREQAVRYIALDAPLQLTNYDPTVLKTIYNQVSQVTEAWNLQGLTGEGVGVAVLDTGVSPHDDIRGRLTVIKNNGRALHGGDANGHGTHVAGIIAGRSVSGDYLGVAPEAQIIGIKIADDMGRSTEADLLRGLQWVYDNRVRYNIRVVNLSVSGSVQTSYMNSAIDAGVERLWKAGVVVVVAAGNRGNISGAVSFPPANDPFAITVGALDDGGSTWAGDDSLAYFSSVGTTQDGFTKPEIVAPGRKIVSLLANNGVTLALRFPERTTDGKYLRLSGTSMAAPVVSGAVALLLQKYPSLTPDQVKWALISGALPYANQPAGTAPALNLRSTMSWLAAGNPGSANQGLTWNPGISATDSAVGWSNAYWENAYWENAYWESVYTENADFMFTDFD